MKNEISSDVAASAALSGRARLHLRDGLTNLNAGTVSPTPKPVHAAREALALEQAEDAINFVFRRAPTLIARSRAALATALGGRSQDFLLFTNASYAVNTVLRSFPFKAGDEILITDQEYDHYMPLLRRVAREKELQVIRWHVPLPGESGYDETFASAEALTTAFMQAATPRTRLVFVSHVTSPTGLVLPVASICRAARARGIMSFIDGAHAPGHVPVSLPAINADVYAANVHKWMMGAVGSGFLYVRADARRYIEPLVTSAYYEGKIDTDAGWALSHEYQGTRDLTALAVVDEAVRFKQGLGEELLTAHWRSLVAHCRGGMQALGFEALTPDAAEFSGCMVSFRVPESVSGGPFDPLKIWEHIRTRHQIELAFPVLGGKERTLRVSNAWFNTKAELDHLLAVMRAFDWNAVR